MSEKVKWAKPLCIYHANCVDGLAAAWVVNEYARRYGVEYEFHPGVYGESPPDVTGREVILVDFSYPREVLIAMAAEAETILVLDHHETAERNLVGLPDNVVVEFDMNRSGAMMTWDFMMNEEPPMLLRYVQDRDLWRFELEGTREVMAAVFSYPLEMKVFDRLVHEDITELRAMGRHLERKQRRDIDAYIRVANNRGELAGYNVPIINVPPSWASDAGHILAQGEPFAACYYDTSTGRVFSLRSAADGLNVAEIAEKFGGGGHKHAAGFRLTGQFLGV